MKKVFLYLFALIVCSETMFAEIIEHVQIGYLYYNLDTENQTAEVTYQSLSAVESNYSGLKTITIPDSVEYNSATYSVKSVGYYAFSLCSDLTNINIPKSVIGIGEYAFLRCTCLTDIEIPNGVISMGEYVFYGCTNLASITIPNSVTSMGEGIFYDCQSLMNVTLSNNITSIEDWTFTNCYNLTSITIPESVKIIGLYAFEWCFHLSDITIPNGVTNIEGSAFAYCSGLTKIKSEADTPPICDSNVFTNVEKSIPLYVPTGSVDAYKTAYVWEEFTNIIGSELAIDHVNSEDRANSLKLFRDGQLLIQSGDRTYTPTGAEVK